MDVFVTHSLELPVEQVSAGLRADLERAFTHANPDYEKRVRAKRWTGNIPKTFSTLGEAHGRLLVPRGSADVLRKLLQQHGAEPQYFDQRVSLPPVDFEATENAQPLESRDYQERIIEACFERENCLIRAGTGSGKTEAAIEFIRRARQPALVIVWSSGLLDQWRKRIAKRLGWAIEDVGILSGSKRKVRGITVAMQQTLWHCADEYAETFGVVVCDEVQRFAARTLRETIGAFRARYRIGVSADERRKDRQEKLIYEAFGPVAAEVKRDRLEREGHVCPVKIVVHPTTLRIGWLEATPVADRPQVLQERYAKVLDEIEGDEGRIEEAVEIAVREARAGHFVLGFAERVGMCRAFMERTSLHYGVPCGIFLGGAKNRTVYDETIERLENGGLQVAIGTSCVYQGVDVPKLDVGIALTPTAGNRQVFEQQMGRLRRPTPGKTHGVFHYFWDQHLFPRHLRNLQQWYGDLVSIAV